MTAMRLARLPGMRWMPSMFVLLLSALAAAAPPGLFEQYGDGNRHFDELEIGDMLVYFHQRTIGEATIEKEYIVYQLDKDTGELLARKSRWRDDLPVDMPKARLSQAQAEALVEGQILFSRLYIISPDSDVFPLDPTPRNPCWVVRSLNEHGEYVVTIIDALTGVLLGNGVPPPYTAFSMTGPQYDHPCSGAWSSWSNSAEWWFNTMGYSTEKVEWPTEAKVQSHVQSDDTAMFYELAHGGSTSFANGCLGGTSYEFVTAIEIETWMVDYEKMPFAFIGSCDGMCSTGNHTFASEFRKGSSENTTVVGYCGMSEAQCDVCWTYSLAWQGALFNYMNQGYTVREAFDQANADYTTCSGANNCMRFVGDEDFAVVPPVDRKWPDCNGNDVPDALDLTGGTSADCNGNAVPDECDTIGGGDFNVDGDVDLADYAALADCLGGPGIPSTPPDPECADIYLDAFDFDDDGDVDLNDFAEFQEAFMRPRVIYVDVDATGGADTGESWTDAYPDLQDGLAAALPGDQVWIAEGMYHPAGPGGDRNISFEPLDGVALRGGFAGVETALDERDLAAHETILSADLNGNDLPGFVNNSENSYHVLNTSEASASTILDGLIIEGGNANGEDDAIRGGGIFNRAGSPTIVNCTLRGNYALALGGGMHTREGGSPTLVNCVIAGNSVTTLKGGGLHFFQSTANLINCTIVGNTATTAGGVILSQTTSNLVNCIFWGNTDSGGSTEAAQLTDITFTPTIDYSCVEHWSGTYGGTGNTGADPALADAPGTDLVWGTADDDLRLTGVSPVIDAADGDAVPADTADMDGDVDKTEQVPWDRDGNARIVDDAGTPNTGAGTEPYVDMGAYEY